MYDNMKACGRDLTGAPEWVKADYYQAHKNHDCLWSDEAGVRVPPVSLGMMLTFRATAALGTSVRWAAAQEKMTTSEFLRDAVTRRVSDVQAAYYETEPES
jgi:hypothetical protein